MKENLRDTIMARNENRDYWNRIISKAYRSHEPIRRWCAGHSIRAGVFYEGAKELGYTKDGKIQKNAWS